MCRDYFWVFCHPSNVIWNLDDTDEARVEKPRAPGGMTGGVEFEAMSYLVRYFVYYVSKDTDDLHNDLRGYASLSCLFHHAVFSHVKSATPPYDVDCLLPPCPVTPDMYARPYHAGALVLVWMPAASPPHARRSGSSIDHTSQAAERGSKNCFG